MTDDKELPPIPPLKCGQDEDGTYWAEWHIYHGVGDTMAEALGDLGDQIKKAGDKRSSDGSD